MASYPPVQSVLRAIELLQALNRQPISTLDALHRQTGIPKPTLVRLLSTLAEKGLVRRAPRYGAYYLTARVKTLSSGYHSEPRIIEAGRAHLDALTREIKWPLALAVFDTDAVVVQYSTIPTSALSLLHSSIGMRLSLVSRALGRAYLAFCEPAERAMLLSLLQQSGNPEDAPAKDVAKVEAALDIVREQGYALRDPSVRPVSGTLAVPVFDDGHVVASLGLTWFASTFGSDEAVRRYLPQLQAVAAQIGQEMAQESEAAAGAGEGGEPH